MRANTLLKEQKYYENFKSNNALNLYDKLLESYNYKNKLILNEVVFKPSADQILTGIKNLKNSIINSGFKINLDSLLDKLIKEIENESKKSLNLTRNSKGRLKNSLGTFLTEFQESAKNIIEKQKGGSLTVDEAENLLGRAQEKLKNETKTQLDAELDRLERSRGGSSGTTTAPTGGSTSILRDPAPIIRTKTQNLERLANEILSQGNRVFGDLSAAKIQVNKLVNAKSTSEQLVTQAEMTNVIDSFIAGIEDRALREDAKNWVSQQPFYTDWNGFCVSKIRERANLNQELKAAREARTNPTLWQRYKQKPYINTFKLVSAVTTIGFIIYGISKAVSYFNNEQDKKTVEKILARCAATKDTSSVCLAAAEKQKMFDDEAVQKALGEVLSAKQAEELKLKAKSEEASTSKEQPKEQTKEGERVVPYKEDGKPFNVLIKTDKEGKKRYFWYDEKSKKPISEFTETDRIKDVEDQNKN